MPRHFTAAVFYHTLSVPYLFSSFKILYFLYSLTRLYACSLFLFASEGVAVLHTLHNNDSYKLNGEFSST